eukprot:1179665-Lingulodinium_polyedra.AAC.1
MRGRLDWAGQTQTPHIQPNPRLDWVGLEWSGWTTGTQSNDWTSGLGWTGMVQSDTQPIGLRRTAPT